MSGWRKEERLDYRCLELSNSCHCFRGLWYGFVFVNGVELESVWPTRTAMLAMVLEVMQGQCCCSSSKGRLTNHPTGLHGVPLRVGGEDDRCRPPRKNS